MTTLLIRLAGPMQAWGTQSRFEVRDTGLEPSKSGVIGLLCAALGRPRNAPIDDLCALKMGVRVDHEGILKRDFHTAGGGKFNGAPYGIYRANGSFRAEAVLSSRYYLADADFLVGLEGEDTDLLAQLHHSLAAPRWQLFLGRKAFPPGLPVYIPDGLRNLPLEPALRTYPWRPRFPLDSPPDNRLRLVLTVGPGESNEVRCDEPFTFNLNQRRFGHCTLRYVKTIFMELTSDLIVEDTPCSTPS